MDTTQGQLGNGTDSSDDWTNPFNTRTDRGPTSWDVTHNLQVSLLYHFPNIGYEHFAAKLLHGWWTGNIVSVQSGYPMTPSLSFNNSNSDLGDTVYSFTRADVVTSANLANAKSIDPLATVYNPATVVTGNPNQWFNPHMFTVGPFGHLGTASRGMIRGPGLGSWDFSLNKDTALPFLGESGKLVFRAEFFNILNRANFGLPRLASGSNIVFNQVFTPAPVSVVNPTAGQITGTATTSRQIQFALRVEF